MRNTAIYETLIMLIKSSLFAVLQSINIIKMIFIQSDLETPDNDQKVKFSKFI